MCCCGGECTHGNEPGAEGRTLGRRQFLMAGGLAGAGLGLLATTGAFAQTPDADGGPVFEPIPKQPARIMGVFLYPPAEVVLRGEAEDAWAPHQWFTWPGNQFEPQAQHERFLREINAAAKRVGVQVEMLPEALYQDEKVAAYVDQVKAAQPDAVLIVNFWNSFSNKAQAIIAGCGIPAILYHPVGSHHQIPPEAFRTGPNLYYIHSIENWDAIERGFRAVHAKRQLSQSRLLRVSGNLTERAEAYEEGLGVSVVGIPAGEFNDTFDATPADDEVAAFARSVFERAGRITDVAENALLDAARAHFAVQRVMARYGADAITIQCLMLQHRKPCISFAYNNGNLIPSGCENDLNAVLTLMLGRHLFERAGFIHNPDFDTERNQYYGSHCTCAWELEGPGKGDRPFDVRPFFHQLPKTPALDVQWEPGASVVLSKYSSEKRVLDNWAGSVVSSPTCPPAGGCATRVLVDIPNVPDICDIYNGPHPVLFAGADLAARMRVFARLYGMELRTNV